MKRSELKSVIREAVEEVMKEFAPLGVANEGMLNEKAPPNFPKALHDKLLKQYKDDESKAYATMWKIFHANNSGHKKVNEMWMGWENKSRDESYDPDDVERQDYERNIARHNRKNPQRFPCPSCGEEDALSAWEKSKGYQCKSCADAEEGTGYLGENKEVKKEEIEQETPHDESDMNNPEEAKEVELAKKMKALADELLSMHGVTDETAEEKPEGEEEQA